MSIKLLKPRALMVVLKVLYENTEFGKFPLQANLKVAGWTYQWSWTSPGPSSKNSSNYLILWVSGLPLSFSQKSVRTDRSESMFLKYILSMFLVCLLTNHTEKEILYLFNYILRMSCANLFQHLSRPGES